MLIFLYILYWRNNDRDALEMSHIAPHIVGVVTASKIVACKWGQSFELVIAREGKGTLSKASPKALEG